MQIGPHPRILADAGGLGAPVLVLRRIRIGPLHLGDLGNGAFRELTEGEVTALYAAAKAAQGAESPAARANFRRTVGSLGNGDNERSSSRPRDAQ